MKRCSKCKQTKKSEHFYKLKSGKLSYWCRECNRETTRKWKKSAAGKASDKKYKLSEKGKASRKRYSRGQARKKTRERYYKNKGKQTAKIFHRKWRKTARGKRRRPALLWCLFLPKLSDSDVSKVADLLDSGALFSMNDLAPSSPLLARNVGRAPF